MNVRATYAPCFVVAIDVVVLPASTATLGLDDQADTFSFYLRVALPDDPAALNAWLASPPTIFRFTPGRELASNPLAAPPSRPRGTGIGEDLLSAVNTLGYVIKTELGGTTLSTANADPASFNGDACIQAGHFCGGDNRDALYGGSAGTFVLDEPGGT